METITLTVNTTIDENDGGEGGTGLSLRDAISITNQSPENNYIIELEGGSTHTLNLDSGDPGDNHLDIEQGNVTIRATGSERAIIDASGLENPDIVLHILGNANVSLENLTITGGVAEGNDSTEGIQRGGGLSIDQTSTVTVTNSLITGNSAATTGGGIFAGEETTVTLIDSQVSNNQSNFNGGGILTASNNFTLRNSTITGNTVTDGPPSDKSGRGGGIMVYGGTTNILETTISDNSSVYDSGGGIAVINAEANIYSSTISNNTSDSSGGGIHVDNFSSPSVVSVVNSTISGNVSDFVGGGVYLDYLGFTASGNDISILISNSTITDNTANANLDDIRGGAGGGIATGQDNRIALTNSIVTGNFDGRDNTASDVSGFFYTDFAFGVLGERGILGDGNNIIGTLDQVGGTIGTGSDIVGVDPLLTPLQDNGGTTLTHALLENSPAINGGNNDFIPADFFDLDGDGNTEERVPLNSSGSERIFNETVDIGAVELGSTANTSNS